MLITSTRQNLSQYPKVKIHFYGISIEIMSTKFGTNANLLEIHTGRDENVMKKEHVPDIDPCILQGAPQQPTRHQAFQNKPTTK